MQETLERLGALGIRQAIHIQTTRSCIGTIAAQLPERQGRQTLLGTTAYRGHHGSVHGRQRQMGIALPSPVKAGVILRFFQQGQILQADTVAGRIKRRQRRTIVGFRATRTYSMADPNVNGTTYDSLVHVVVGLAIVAAAVVAFAIAATRHGL